MNKGYYRHKYKVNEISIIDIDMNVSFNQSNCTMNISFNMNNSRMNNRKIDTNQYKSALIFLHE